MGLFNLATNLIKLPINITRDIVRIIEDNELPPVEESKTVENIEKIAEELDKIAV